MTSCFASLCFALVLSACGSLLMEKEKERQEQKKIGEITDSHDRTSGHTALCPECLHAGFFPPDCVESARCVALRRVNDHKMISDGTAMPDG